MAWVVGAAATGFAIEETTQGIALADWRATLTLEGGDTRAAEGAAPVADGSGLALALRFGTLTLGLRVAGGDDGACIAGELRNEGDTPVRVAAVTLAPAEVRFAPDAGRFRVFANGYQSWAQSRSFGPDERVRVPLPAFARLMQDDLRNLAGGRRGDVRAAMFALVGALAPGRFLLVGQGRPFDQFLQLAVQLGAGDEPPRLTVGLQLGGQTIAPGTAVRLDDVLFVAGDHANRVLDRYLDAVRAVPESPAPAPVGWCSWYYYFTKISAENIGENIDEAQRHGAKWHYIQIDDGYQTQVGDWLSLNARFPDGLKPLVARIEAAGMRAGLWLAPFSARADSQVFRAHPDWFLKDDRGRPAVAGWNPMWGLGGTFHALDTTHPEAAAWLSEVVRTLVHEWGFRYLKLDFVYSAALYARAHDPHLSPAQRLKRGYEIVRRAAGPDVFLLGCGAPLSASIGHVDGMRIGPDVAPYWFPTVRYHLTRDPHALSAKFAIRSTLTRAPMHRRLWENDPDCLLLRDTETKLTPAERETLATAIAVTGGMLLVSDRLARVEDTFWQRLARIEEVAAACAGARPWPLDFMEREMPELVWSSAGYLAVFNFEDRPVEKRVPYAPHLAGLLPEDARLASVWDARTFRIANGTLDLGTLPAHGSVLLTLAAD